MHECWLGKRLVATLLIAGFVGFLVVVFLKVMLFAVILIMPMIGLAFTHTLLVGFVVGVIRFLGLERASSDADGQRQNPDNLPKVCFHGREMGTPVAVQSDTRWWWSRETG
jgi:hypothetical protein